MLLDTLQIEVRDRLRADSYFSDVPVYEERQKDLDNEIARALAALTGQASKRGICVVVGAAQLRVQHPNAQHFDDNLLTVTAFENVLFNGDATTGTGKAAIDVCTRAAFVLWHYMPLGIAQAFWPDREAVVPIAGRNPQEIAYQHRLRIDPVLDADARVVTPVISPVSGAVPQTVTITCATAGASIYYTLDDSHPYSGNANAVLYTAPFAVSAACSVRAIAYKSGMIASSSDLATFT